MFSRARPGIMTSSLTLVLRCPLSPPPFFLPFARPFLSALEHQTVLSPELDEKHQEKAKRPAVGRPRVKTLNIDVSSYQPAVQCENLMFTTASPQSAPDKLVFFFLVLRQFLLESAIECVKVKILVSNPTCRKTPIRTEAEAAKHKLTKG